MCDTVSVMPLYRVQPLNGPSTIRLTSTRRYSPSVNDVLSLLLTLLPSLFSLGDCGWYSPAVKVEVLLFSLCHLIYYYYYLD